MKQRWKESAETSFMKDETVTKVCIRHDIDNCFRCILEDEAEIRRNKVAASIEAQLLPQSSRKRR